MMLCPRSSGVKHQRDGDCPGIRLQKPLEKVDLPGGDAPKCRSRVPVGYGVAAGWASRPWLPTERGRFRAAVVRLGDDPASRSVSPQGVVDRAAAEDPGPTRPGSDWPSSGVPLNRIVMVLHFHRAVSRSARGHAVRAVRVRRGRFGPLAARTFSNPRGSTNKAIDTIRQDDINR